MELVLKRLQGEAREKNGRMELRATTESNGDQEEIGEVVVYNLGGSIQKPMVRLEGIQRDSDLKTEQRKESGAWIEQALAVMRVT